MTVAHSKTLEDLYANARLNEETGCLEWQSGISSGYGFAWSNGRYYGAHRLAYMLAHDTELATDEFVCHECDNTRCINVAHLFLGSSIDNSRDRDVKGRQARGEKNGQSKLTKEQVREIRELAKSGMRHKDIARRFDVSRCAVTKVANGTQWNWLD